MAPERPSKGFAASKKPPKKPKKRTAAQTQKNNARFINHAIKKHSQSQEKELTATRLAEEGWTSAINNMHLADSIKSDSADQILVDEAWTLTTSAYEPQTAPGYQPPSEPFDEHTPSTPVMSGLDEGCCSPIAPAFSLSHRDSKLVDWTSRPAVSLRVTGQIQAPVPVTRLNKTPSTTICSRMRRC
jgi:hypothetical protein